MIQKANTYGIYVANNYGIYVANCVNCNAQYVGQTKINFRLDGITIDILGKNLIFRSKSILPLSATL